MFLSCEGRVEASCPNCVECFLALIRAIADVPPPADENSPEAIEANLRFPTHRYDPNLLLIGALHRMGARILNEHGLLSSVHPGLNSPYLKYIFERDSAALSAVSDDLPSDLRWATVREQDFELVQSRTAIPRVPSVLRFMPSVAIFPAHPDSAAMKDDLPIAWGFLNQDGSLSSLHVEEGWRGRGLAKKVAARLFRKVLPEAFDISGEFGGGYGHADVAPSNVASRAVCESIGGTSSPERIVYWLRVDLEKAKAYPKEVVNGGLAAHV
jgi:hypothetical protein